MNWWIAAGVFVIMWLLAPDSPPIDRSQNVIRQYVLHIGVTSIVAAVPALLIGHGAA